MDNYEWIKTKITAILLLLIFVATVIILME
jgi:hypothetical protein